MSDSPQRKKRKTSAASEQQEDTPAARALQPFAPFSLSGVLPVCFLRASTYFLSLPSQVLAFTRGSTTTSIAAAPAVSLVDLLNDDSLRHIVSFCDAFSLGFLERSCKKFSNRPRTMTESAWKYLDDQISNVAKYYLRYDHEGVDYDSNKTRVVRFVVAARLADQVQPHIASHRHSNCWYEDVEDDSSTSDNKSDECCTGCAHIPDQLDVACFSSENGGNGDRYEFFLRIFRKSDQRIMWQGFMGRSIFWENNVELVFRGGFDPVKDFPEFTKVLDALEGDNDNDRQTREDFFDAVGLIVVAYTYNESVESAKLVFASTQLATRNPYDEEDSESDTFRGIPVRTHSLPRDGDEGESEEGLHTYVEFSAPTNLCRDWHFSHRGMIPQFVLWYSAEW